MLVNVTDVVTSEGKVVEKQADLEMETFVCQLGEFTIRKKEPLFLRMSNTGHGKAQIEGRTCLVLVMNCDRCLQEVEETVNISCTRQIEVPQKDAGSDDEDEQNFMEGYQLNAEDLIRSELLMNWPMKVLCSDTCKGICTVCGKNLNTGDCGCDTFVPDPRMAAIKDIFNANKEV